MSRAPAIADYGVIGDGRSAALVSNRGAIDWLCWPRVDSAPVFAALLDPQHGGSWQIAPIEAARVTRAYIEDTNVLVTRFETAGGRVAVTDLMTVASEADKTRILMPDHELVRRIAGEHGCVEVEVRIAPRPNFGGRWQRIENLGALGIRWCVGRALMTLRADVPLSLDESGDVIARLTIRAGETITFSLAFDQEGPAVLLPLGANAAERIDRSIAWWKAWAARATYDGPYRAAVVRSALALKLMSYAPSGAIVAAPTTSLPEREGGDLNWDYRFCWLRDASFTARALLELGYVEDACAFSSWMLHSTRLTRPKLRVLYDVFGNAPQDERTITGAAGYRGSIPVRVGNAAMDQLQLDVYGQVIDAAAQIARLHGSIDHETRELLHDFGGYVCRHWRQPDAGIWEPRNELRHRTHSRLSCWVAMDRLLQLHDAGLLARIDADELAAQRAAIRADIELHAFDPSIMAYTSELAPSGMDASTLLMSWYGFHRADSLRMRSTYKRIYARLAAAPGLFYRYEDSSEGAFWICSFWAVEHLVRGGGTPGEAQRMFELACSYANDLGLMSEEVDARTGHQLGNFPQAYTHVGLISAALSIEQRGYERPRSPVHREEVRA
ncbi:MAG: glycoside hydrolase family 15 protein [Kofleriaceae bacterium]|nr:glycoside hydrolase family 15 protein [Kofleriaceae bacterium]